VAAEKNHYANTGSLMARQEIHLELLLGRRVYALNGRAIGRLEEARAEVDQGVASVTEFLVGTYSLFDRLSAWQIGRAILGLFGSAIKSGYSVQWNQIDFTNPAHLKLTCNVTELSPLGVDKNGRH
jgi:sporulation protein YlmC with PRC-barrel domain